MLRMLKRELPQILLYFNTHSLEIIEKLLKNMWDDNKFRSFFDTEIEFVRDKQTIDYAIFMKSLEFIQVSEIYDFYKNAFEYCHKNAF